MIPSRSMFASYQAHGHEMSCESIIHGQPTVAASEALCAPIFAEKERLGRHPSSGLLLAVSCGAGQQTHFAVREFRKLDRRSFHDHSVVSCTTASSCVGQLVENSQQPGIRDCYPLQVAMFAWQPQILVQHRDIMRGRVSAYREGAGLPSTSPRASSPRSHRCRIPSQRAFLGSTCCAWLRDVDARLRQRHS